MSSCVPVPSTSTIQRLTRSRSWRAASRPDPDPEHACRVSNAPPIAMSPRQGQRRTRSAPGLQARDGAESHRFALRIRAALNGARPGDSEASRSEQARTSAPQSGQTAGSGSRTSTANCARHPRHAPATVCRRSGKTAGRCAPSKRNRVTSSPHNERQYRPAVRPSNDKRAPQETEQRYKPKPAPKCSNARSALAAARASAMKSTTPPRREFRETRPDRHPNRSTRYNRGAPRQEPTTRRSTTSCRPSRGAPPIRTGPLSSMQHFCC